MCLFWVFIFFKLHYLEKIFHTIALCVRFVWFKIYIFLHGNVNFEVAKIEEKKSNALNHVAFWVVICEVLKSKLKMLFTSFEKMTFLFIVWCTYSVMHNGLEFFKKEHHFIKGFHDCHHIQCVFYKKNKNYKISHQNTQL